MTKRGYVMLRFSAPRLPKGAHEAWLEASKKIASTMWPSMQAMGAVKWTLVSDSHRNVPRNMLIAEFDSEENAKAWHASQVAADDLMKWVENGALDLSCNVYGFHSEG